MPNKRPSPEATAQLPSHIQEKLKDPSYDIRKDPEGMRHLLTATVGGGFAKLAQNVGGAGQPPPRPGQAPGVGAPGIPKSRAPGVGNHMSFQQPFPGMGSSIPPEGKAEQQQFQFPAHKAQTPPGAEPPGQGEPGGFFKNLQGRQVNKPAVKGAVKGVLDAHARSQYFRHAGFGAALRYTLGMPQVPSHVNDYLNARHNQQVRGVDPGDVQVQHEPWHF